MQLEIRAAGPLASIPQPLATGVCFPPGKVLAVPCACLTAEPAHQVFAQPQVLARWPDGSVRWLLLDFLLPPQVHTVHTWQLHLSPDATTDIPDLLSFDDRPESLAIDTGPARFDLPRQSNTLFLQVPAARLTLTDARGEVHSPLFCTRLEIRGPIRTTAVLEGEACGLRIRARLSFFAGTALVRADLTLHNPRSARHRGGLWDLGDPGSVLFRDFSLHLPLAADPAIVFRPEPGLPLRQTTGRFEIFQGSSGGENWQSPVHVNRHGEVPTQFRGYRVRDGNQETTGLRALPLVAVAGPSHQIAVAVPEFWQQFPTAIEVADGVLSVRLFPGQFGDLFELQGGERKTRTVWLHLGPADTDPAETLGWVHAPAIVRPLLDASNEPGLLLPSPPASGGEGLGVRGADAVLPRLESYFAEALDGECSIPANRERIDEYGWRNFGEIFADHEQVYYTGPQPLISHYNNQFDMVHGFLLHFLRTGDRRWFDLGDTLARHVMDIDIYHTRKDKWSYNGGLFWHTDHYRHAFTATHRCYSKANKRPGRSYGGGPGNEHNYTTGLLLYHFLTGNPDAAAAVVSLADWVVHMEDGRLNLFAVVDDGPSGLTSSTGGRTYHGPGRGAGNSINALLDGWTLTGRRSYLDLAEILVRRCIHPADDLDALNMGDPESRWSASVFLSRLAKYLALKEIIGELDRTYVHAQASLLHYARWMLDHERPYFDQVEKLEFPTEVWAAQEMRKANVFRHAARHADEPLRSQLYDRGEQFAERAWNDLLRFETRAAARAVAIVMIEGLLDCGFRSRSAPPAARAPQTFDFGVPEPFVPQRLRVLGRMRSATGLVEVAFRLLDPRRWLAYRRNTRQGREETP
jgi:hypothetical protein